MKKLRFNRPLRRRKPEETPPDRSEDVYEQSFLSLLRIKGGVLLFFIAILGVGGIVVISVAPLLVLGILLLGFALYGVLRKEWSRTVRVLCGTAAMFGLCLAVYSTMYDGNALLSRLKLVVDKVRPGPSKADLELKKKLRAEEVVRKKREFDAFMRIAELRKKYSNLPEDYPKLLEEIHALAEDSKDLKSGAGVKMYVQLQYEEIKRDASYYQGSFGHLPIYKKIYGTGGTEK